MKMALNGQGKMKMRGFDKRGQACIMDDIRNIHL